METKSNGFHFTGDVRLLMREGDKINPETRPDLWGRLMLRDEPEGNRKRVQNETTR